MPRRHTLCDMGTAVEPTVPQGRLLILAGTLIWSLGGLFAKLLTQENATGLNVPPVRGETIALYRVLFAGLVLVPTLRRRDLSFRPLMLVMALCFAAMNGLYVTAMAEGTAANAVLLQYTAPMWMYAASVWLLGEAADRRSSVALAIGLGWFVVLSLQNPELRSYFVGDELVTIEQRRDKEAVELATQAGDVSGMIRAHNNLGVMHLLLGNAEKARAHVDESQRIAEHFGHRAYVRFAAVYREFEDVDEFKEELKKL